MTLIDLIQSTPAAPLTRQRFLEWLNNGAQLSRDENPQEHLCVFFIPFNPQTGEVFITHHRKSGLWLPPGGHVDEGELPVAAVVRELNEELGLHLLPEDVPAPFLLTVTTITVSANPVPCKTHYDIWYLIPCDESALNSDMAEFHEVRWLSIAQAHTLVSDPTTREALAAIEAMLSP